MELPELSESGGWASPCRLLVWLRDWEDSRGLMATSVGLEETTGWGWAGPAVSGLTILPSLCGPIGCRLGKDAVDLWTKVLVRCVSLRHQFGIFHGARDAPGPGLADTTGKFEWYRT